MLRLSYRLQLLASAGPHFGVSPVPRLSLLFPKLLSESTQLPCDWIWCLRVSFNWEGVPAEDTIMGTITSSRSPCHQPPPSRSSLPPLATCQQESAPSLYEQLQLATLPIPAQEPEPRNNHAAVLLW